MDPILEEILNTEGLKSLTTKQEIINFLKEQRVNLLGDENQLGKPDDYFLKLEWADYDEKTKSSMVASRKCMLGQHIDNILFELENKDKEKLEELRRERERYQNQNDLIEELKTNPNPDPTKFQYKPFDNYYIPDSYNPPPTNSVPEINNHFLFYNTHWKRLPNERISKTNSGIKVEIKTLFKDTLSIDGVGYRYKEFSSDEITKQNQQKIGDIDKEIQKINEEKIPDPHSFLEESFLKNRDCMGLLELPKDQNFKIPNEISLNLKKNENIEMC